MVKCPCTKDCASRSADCHSTCEAFLEYDKARIAESKNKFSAYAGGGDCFPPFTASTFATMKRCDKYRQSKARGRIK